MADDDLERWARQLADAAGGELRRELSRGAQRLALFGERKAKENATEAPRSRSGHLRRSILGTFAERADGVDVILRAGGGTRDVRYAKMQEEGGTVNAKPGKMLAIPLARAKTAAGVVKGKYRRPGGLRNVPGLFAFTARSGKGYLGERTKGGQILAVFALKESVTVPATRFLGRARDAMIAKLPPMFEGALDAKTEIR